MSINGKIIFILLSSILAIVFINTNNYYLLFLEAGLIVFSFIKLNKVISILMLASFIFFLNYKPNKCDDIQQEFIECNFQVFQAKDKYLIVSKEKTNYLVYINNLEETFYNGDEVNISGTIKKIEKDLDLYVFEFQKYLQNKRVFYEITNANISLIKHNYSISNKIIDFVTNNLYGSSYNMTKMLLFNDKSVDQEVINNLEDINAIHLFVVSGFHLSFLFSICLKIFGFLKDKAWILAMIICGFYIYLLNFSISSSRSFLCLLISYLSFKKIKGMDCLALSGLITILIEPLNVFDYSFILSYLLTFTLLLSSNILSSLTNLKKNIIMSFICLLAVLPIIININYKINFLSFFTNIILSYMVSIIFILTLLGLFISPINGNLFGLIYDKFNGLIKYIANTSGSLLFGHLSSFEMIIYYVILFFIFLFLEKKKVKQFTMLFLTLCIFMTTIYHKGYFLFYQQITFLNVYQGDCTIIQDKFTNKVMMVDTGGLKNYDIASKKIIPFLNYMGIKKIDLVVITHPDYDHNGALENLKNYIAIEKIIDDYRIDEIKLGNFHFINLNKYANNYNDENNQSIVLYGKVCNYNILLTGDIDSSVEEKIITDNTDLDVDILKISHHGSKFSTSENFLKAIKPTYAIISVGGNNYYGHPHEETINRLLENEIIIYRTDLNGTIKISYNFKDLYFIESAK